MISDNFKKAILSYVYYMGGIDLWIRVYFGPRLIDPSWPMIKLRSLFIYITFNSFDTYLCLPKLVSGGWKRVCMRDPKTVIVLAQYEH